MTDTATELPASDEVAAPKPKRTGIVVLSVLVVLLLGASGAFGTLYFLEKKASADRVQQYEGKDGEIAELTKKLLAAEATARDAKSAQTAAESKNWAANNCLTAAQKYAAAVRDGQADEWTRGNFFQSCR